MTERVSIGQDLAVLSLIAIGLLWNVLSMFRREGDPYQLMAVYCILFVVLAVGWHPQNVTQSHLIVAFMVSFFLRIPFLSMWPITSTDLQRNIVFGSLLADGLDPYSYIGFAVPGLVAEGKLNLRVWYNPLWDNWATHSFDYPSIAAWFFGLVALISPLNNSDLSIMIAKISLLIFDYGCAFLILLIGRTMTFQGKTFGRRSLVLYLLNPISVYQVALEGQFEVIPVFFGLCSIYLVMIAIKKEKSKLESHILISLAGLAISFAILCKYYHVILLLPLIGLLALKDWKLMLRFNLTWAFSLFYFSLPFIYSGGYVSGFLDFQFTREHNPLYGAFSYGNAFLLFLLICALGFYFVIFDEDRPQLFLWATTSFFGVFFLLSRSFLPWYILIFYTTSPITTANRDPILNSALWVWSLILYAGVWATGFVAPLFLILCFGVVFTLERVNRRIYSPFSVIITNLERLLSEIRSMWN